ncbi:HAD-IIIA family hydrolase [Rhizobium rhizogenes]|uniref:HAD-IIIA family hydrolase n=1 Tax=Rhizobium rhizogenes TaxID=359 RepID=UPI00138DF8C2|nr:HAD-IIIA family hydrolase [Rhizobium rhizogenes]
MMSVKGICEERALAKNWLSGTALPLWTSVGYDAKLGLFHERLTLTGEPIETLPRRLMVQCRQIYVVAQATLIGVMDGRALLETTFTQVLRHFHKPETDLKWIFSINPDGSVRDARCDCYSLAFVLFALAWLYRIKPDELYLELADEIVAVLDRHMAAELGGITDGAPRPDEYLRQNPNMHLIEAYLALYEATGAQQYLARARSMYDLFCGHIFLHDHAAIPELHDSLWRVADLEQAWYEPGHHFEWVWLSRRLARASGDDVTGQVQSLLLRALDEGIDDANLSIERVSVLSRERTVSRRSWGSCEYIKACAAEAEANPSESGIWADRAACSLRALRETFLSTPVKGLWIDRVDRHGGALSTDVPASSLYHLTLAIVECDRVFGTVTPKSYASKPSPALFLDRDGVINLDTGYPNKPSDINFVPGIAEAIKMATAAGYQVVVVSNQSGVARGMMTEADVLRLHGWMASELSQQGADISAWYHCPFHEQASVDVYKYEKHPDRKPNPGMILRAAHDLNIDLSRSKLIGDQETDMEAARRGGVTPYLFRDGDMLTFMAKVMTASL